MTLFQAFILGIVQGLTEFLPVSSSGHLVIFQAMFGFSPNDLTFEVIVHLATLVAVCLYFYKRFFELDQKTILLLFVASLPAAIFGYFFESNITQAFSSIIATGIGLLWTGILLLSSKNINTTTKSLKEFNHKKGFAIGIAQAIAIFPGVSRSGSTVVAGLHLGLKRTDAFYFSFLMAIPVILGASILELSDMDSYNQLFNLTNFVGFVTSMIVGLLALKILNKLIISQKFHFFGYYCLTLGLLIISYALLT